MGKVTKIFLALCCAVAFASAQTVDTTAAPDSSTATPAASSTSVKKATTGNLPGTGKSTNWSKIKDLFL